MANEEQIIGKGNQYYLALSDLVVPYQQVDAILDPTIAIEVNDASNQTEVESTMKELLLSRFWFLDAGIRSEQLCQKYKVYLNENTEIDVYNFQEDFNADQLDLIANTLAKFYHALRDKNLWNLESIQIRSVDRMNEKSGKAYRGLEYPVQKRFELFPASFGSSEWGSLCSTVEWATAHETAHVSLEQYLNGIWNQHLKELGWEILEGKQLLLPGGAKTIHYNSDYKNLPSEYASYGRDDDQAETVVAYLFNQAKLNNIRRDIMTQVFVPAKDQKPMKIVEGEPKLPELTLVTVSTANPKSKPLFVALGTRGTVKPNPVIPLEEYRKLRQD